jgi:hypothetical protein
VRALEESVAWCYDVICFCGALKRGLRCLFAFAECSGETHAVLLLVLRARLRGASVGSSGCLDEKGIEGF